MRDFVLHSISKYSPTPAELAAEVANVATRSDWAGERLDKVLIALRDEGLIELRGGAWVGCSWNG